MPFPRISVNLRSLTHLAGNGRLHWLVATLAL